MSAPEDNVPKAPPGRRLPARDSVFVVVGAIVLLILFGGGAVRSAAEELQPGFERDVLVAVGKPTGAIADALPLQQATGDALSWLSSDEDLGGQDGFAQAASPARAGKASATVSPSEFDAGELGAKTAPVGPLKSLLVTGDSLSQPLDAELARRLSGDGVKVTRDVHIGTGISKSDLLDWGKLSAKQASSDGADAVVVFIGANEGFPLPVAGGRRAQCCGPDWAAAYATRVRQMMDNYRRAGKSRVYWITVPQPRDRDRQDIARAVNAAITVAAGPHRDQVRIVDLAPSFSADGRFHAAIETGGRKRVVRDSDGIHLNDAGAKVTADLVGRRLDRDFTR